MSNLTQEQTMNIIAEVRAVEVEIGKVEAKSKVKRDKERKENILYEARLRGIEKEYGLA